MNTRRSVHSTPRGRRSFFHLRFDGFHGTFGDVQVRRVSYLFFEKQKSIHCSNNASIFRPTAGIWREAASALQNLIFHGRSLASPRLKLSPSFQERFPKSHRDSNFFHLRLTFGIESPGNFPSPMFRGTRRHVDGKLLPVLIFPTKSSSFFREFQLPDASDYTLIPDQSEFRDDGYFRTLRL